MSGRHSRVKPTYRCEHCRNLILESIPFEKHLMMNPSCKQAEREKKAVDFIEDKTKDEQ